MLEPSDDERGIIDVDLYSDGQYWDLLYMPGGGSRHPATHETVDARMHYAKMKGNEVFKVAVRMFVDCAERILARNGFTADDVSLFIPHQANLRIIEAAAKRVNLPMDRVFVNVDRYGNTGAASVYVALEEAIAAGRLKQAATSCCWPPSAAASPGAPPSCGGDHAPMTIAFLFPGQGSQAVGMGTRLLRDRPRGQGVFEEANDALGLDLARLDLRRARGRCWR